MISLLLALSIGLVLLMVKKILDLFTMLAFLEKDKGLPFKTTKEERYLFIKGLY